MTDEDVAGLVELIERERDAWIHGRPPDSAATFEQHQNMTIFGPWGGPGVRGLGEVGPRQRRIAQSFEGGTGSFEPIEVIVGGDVVVVIGIERSVVQFDGYDAPRPWVLRSTQVFRQEPMGWTRLHRHADPLVTPRSLDDTIALLPPD